METKLSRLMQYLSAEQRNIELVEIDKNDELKLIIGSEPIALRFDENSKGMYFPGIGEKIGSEGNIEVVRTNSKGQFVIKPKFIQEYLDSLTEKP
ncbi:hypothetical protein SDC9_124915 [bioreactor metagenome]|uniref:Uncharacterized protein n=1 Tax=bioreactor metagenome TaxID=1076179 RepID=A0A645CLM3_9ZZZZ